MEEGTWGGRWTAMKTMRVQGSENVRKVEGARAVFNKGIYQIRAIVRGSNAPNSFLRVPLCSLLSLHTLFSGIPIIYLIYFIYLTHLSYNPLNVFEDPYGIITSFRTREDQTANGFSQSIAVHIPTIAWRVNSTTHHQTPPQHHAPAHHLTPLSG